ncbi:MAG: tRNA pseudouridine(38-40) synthase TruA [Pseudomonadota bacterium]
MRIALTVEYDGTHYCGWQIQRRDPSVQAVLQGALSRVADESISVVCAGRTDTGVHAVGQVVHFDTNVNRPEKAWTMGTNSFLPPDVSVKGVTLVPDTFSARYSAISRSYRYVIQNGPNRSAMLAKRAAWIHQPLNLKAMHRGAEYLIGEHDFSAFRAAGCQAKSPIRDITRLTICRKRECVYLDIDANAFLHNMIRIMVGSLIKVGKGEESPDWIKALLDGRDRTQSGMTAPAHGLVFVGPRYAPEYNIEPVKNKPEY